MPGNVAIASHIRSNGHRKWIMATDIENGSCRILNVDCIKFGSAGRQFAIAGNVATEPQNQVESESHAIAITKTGIGKIF